MTDSVVQHSSQGSKQSPTTGTASVLESDHTTKDKTTVNAFYSSVSNTDQEMGDKDEEVVSPLSGILAIIEHGVQQFVMHLNPWTMASIAFPLNRSEFNNQTSTFSRKNSPTPNGKWKNGELSQPDQLKLVDLGSTSMFGLLQDNRYLFVKQLVQQQDYVELVHVS